MQWAIAYPEHVEQRQYQLGIREFFSIFIRLRLVSMLKVMLMYRVIVLLQKNVRQVSVMVVMFS